MSDPTPRPRERWSALFHDSTRPIFVLFRTRRIRFVNAAWEQLTGIRSDDAIGRGCVRSGSIEPLYRTLAPPADALRGSVTKVRRPVPPHRAGPAWWDITFVPLTSNSANTGYLGCIDVVGTEATGLPSRKMNPRIANLRDQHSGSYSFDRFTSQSIRGTQLLAQLHHATQTTAPVWIVGENGSGKETLARTIHHHSPVRERAFLACDCLGLQPYLVESLLFGHGGMATSGKLGTLFLKQPARLPRDLQERLLQWLQRATPLPRVICASSNSCASEWASGKLRDEFRTDYSVLELQVPPLRERLEDVSRILSDWGLTVTADVLPILAAHSWPNNLRELRETLFTAATEAGGQPIAPEHLPRYFRERALLAAHPVAAKARTIDLDSILAEVEKRLIAKALAEANGNQTDAAKLLGIARSRLSRRIEALERPTKSG